MPILVISFGKIISMKSATLLPWVRPCPSTWFLMHYQKGKSKKTPWLQPSLLMRLLLISTKFQITRLFLELSTRFRNWSLWQLCHLRMLLQSCLPTISVTTILTNGLIAWTKSLKSSGWPIPNGTMPLELVQHPTKGTTHLNVMTITILTRRQPVIYLSWPITLSNITLKSLNTLANRK